MRWYFVGNSGGIPTDGSFVYCQQDTSGLPSANAPIAADGTILYCNQDVSGLPTP